MPPGCHGLTVMLPQQTTLPSERMAQVWVSPLAMAVYVPVVGGDAWPCSLSPQQRIEPAVLWRAQECLPPLLTVMPMSGGGCGVVAAPGVLVGVTVGLGAGVKVGVGVGV